MDGIEQVVPRLLEDPSHNVVMDGAMSTFALYWAASGEQYDRGQRVLTFLHFAHAGLRWMQWEAARPAPGWREFGGQSWWSHCDPFSVITALLCCTFAGKAPMPSPPQPVKPLIG